MASRTLRTDARSYTAGEVHIYCSFLLNGTSAPDLTEVADGSKKRGGGIASVARNGVGALTMTLNDSFRYVVFAEAHIQDASSPDFARATIGPAANEGGTAAVTLKLNTVNAAGAAADFTSRRCFVHVVLKNSQVGV